MSKKGSIHELALSANPHARMIRNRPGDALIILLRLGDFLIQIPFLAQTVDIFFLERADMNMIITKAMGPIIT
jgi:hypothetical protein